MFLFVHAHIIFLSTLSLRRATKDNPRCPKAAPNFYPRSPCGERPTVDCNLSRRLNFYPRSPCGERLPRCRRHLRDRRFLSTLSLRRATVKRLLPSWELYHFYPRSPCGERPSRLHKNICVWGFLSTLSLRRATMEHLDCKHTKGISIHALLAESDATKTRQLSAWRIFLSTLSLRRATGSPPSKRCAEIDFYPRSPCGERPVTRVASTPTTVISIHALLAESDQNIRSPQACARNFYPRSPCGERRHLTFSSQSNIIFLSTLSLRRATCLHLLKDQSQHHFYPRSPCGERLDMSSAYPAVQCISIHALLAESDAWMLPS